MSHVILGLFMCFLVISGLAEGYEMRPVKYKMISYCLSFRGKCQPTCDLRSEIEVVKLRPFCGTELRCCMGGFTARQDAPKKTSGNPGAYTSFPAPSPTVKTYTTTSAILSTPSRVQVSPGLSSTSKHTPSSPSRDQVSPGLSSTSKHTPSSPSRDQVSPGLSSTSKLTPSRDQVSPGLSSTSKLTPSRDQVSPGLSSTSKLTPSTPSSLPSRSGFTFGIQNAETKTDKSFTSYNRYRKPEGCGVPVLGRVRRIVGGSQAERCLFPWMVYILRDPAKDDLCGGSLVSDRHVITAAHCYDNLGDSWPTLFIGEYNRRDNSSKTKFVTSSYKVTRHPNYSRINFSYDIAILTLNIPIPLEDYECLYPICMPWANHALKVGDSCTVAGWGSTSRTQYNPAVSSPSLMKTQIYVLNDSVCQDKFGIYFNGRSQICAGDLTGKTDSCVGDSGGPFMCSMTNNVNTSTKKMPVQFLMGVISSGGTPCAQADTPALYTDLQEVREWIGSVLN